MVPVIWFPENKNGTCCWSRSTLVPNGWVIKIDSGQALVQFHNSVTALLSSGHSFNKNHANSKSNTTTPTPGPRKPQSPAWWAIVPFLIFSHSNSQMNAGSDDHIAAPTVTNFLKALSFQNIKKNRQHITLCKPLCWVGYWKEQAFQYLHTMGQHQLWAACIFSKPA